METKQENEKAVKKEKENNRISFKFHPRGNIYKHEHVIEKEENGKKRRYLAGITSGIKIDGHKEKMTENCIKSFMEQANSGNILLYPDVHGIRQTEDIGKLVSAKTLSNNDWYTEYRLYDKDDGIGAVKLERCDDMWKQINGLPPYTRNGKPAPKQKGFSVEGVVEDKDIIMSSDGVTERIINNVNLDGVVVVPRPAYLSSIAHSCYKALGEKTPYKIHKDKIRKNIDIIFKDKLHESEIEKNFYQKREDLLDVLDETVEEIMKSNENDKKTKLEVLFNTFKGEMIPLILASNHCFTGDTIIESQETVYNYKSKTDKLLKELSSNVSKLCDSFKKKQ